MGMGDKIRIFFQHFHYTISKFTKNIMYYDVGRVYDYLKFTEENLERVLGTTRE